MFTDVLQGLTVGVFGFGAGVLFTETIHLARRAAANAADRAATNAAHRPAPRHLRAEDRVAA